MTSLETKLMHAIAEGKVRKITSILDCNVDINYQDEYGKTALIHAIGSNREDIRTHVVRLILKHGSDVNIQDNWGRTALIYSCMDSDKMDLVRLIIRQKACNPNIIDNDGNTAVIHAVLASNAEAISAIVSSSVTKKLLDLGIKNKSGMSALDLAIKLQKFECCKILAKDGGARSTNVTDGRGLEIILGRDSSSLAMFGQENSKRHRQIHNSKERKCSDHRRSGTPALQESSLSTTPYGDKRNDYLRKFRQERPDLLFPSRQESAQGHQSKMSYSREFSQLSVRSQCNYFSDSNSPRMQKRALTPISTRRKQEEREFFSNSSESPLDSSLVPDSSLFGARMRLPSIPSGKRLCLVTNQSGIDHPGTEV